MTRAQVRAGLKVKVVATWHSSTEKPSSEAFESAGVKVRHIGPAHGPLSDHPDLQPELEELIAQFDVVHIHAMWEEIQHVAARVSQRLDVPYVITPHGMLSPWNLSRGKWRKRLYLALRARRNLNRAAAIHFTCETEARLAKPLHLKAEALVETLGVDLREFEMLPERGTFRRRFPQLGRRPIVLFLGRFEYKKGLDVLIPAFAQCNINDAVLVLAGPDSGYLHETEELVKKYGLTDRVVFTGMLHGPERVAALVDADLFALTSYQENFGIAVIESLAAGTPVLISDQVNIAEQISAAKVGAVVRQNVPEIAMELSRWINDASLRSAAASRARPFVAEQFDWNRIAERWVGHYRRLA